MLFPPFSILARQSDDRFVKQAFGSEVLSPHQKHPCSRPKLAYGDMDTRESAEEHRNVRATSGFHPSESTVDTVSTVGGTEHERDQVVSERAPLCRQLLQYVQRRRAVVNYHAVAQR
jgi:hypothetical protein